jgi:hypothetical protein
VWNSQQTQRYEIVGPQDIMYANGQVISPVTCHNGLTHHTCDVSSAH